MKKTTNAVLLSALVFPGAGHLYLKKYISFLVLFSIACASIVVITGHLLERAQKLTEHLLNGTVAVDIQSMIAFLYADTQDQSGYMELASYGFAVVWLVGVIHSYITAKKNSGTR